jgi:hypothetical protein
MFRSTTPLDQQRQAYGMSALPDCIKTDAVGEYGHAMSKPSGEIARELVSTVNALCERLGDAPEGTALTYHIGHLASDRAPTVTKLDPAERAELDLLADRVWQLAEQGWVHLVQRRLAPECFAYQVVVRPRRVPIAQARWGPERVRRPTIAARRRAA